MLLTTKEIKENYNISRFALLQWEEAGLLHPLRTPGGARRYKKEELDAILGGNNKIAKKEKYMDRYVQSVDFPEVRFKVRDINSAEKTIFIHLTSIADLPKFPSVVKQLLYEHKDEQMFCKNVWRLHAGDYSCDLSISEVINCDEPAKLRKGYILTVTNDIPANIADKHENDYLVCPEFPDLQWPVTSILEANLAIGNIVVEAKMSDYTRGDLQALCDFVFSGDTRRTTIPKELFSKKWSLHKHGKDPILINITSAQIHDTLEEFKIGYSLEIGENEYEADVKCRGEKNFDFHNLHDIFAAYAKSINSPCVLVETNCPDKIDSFSSEETYLTTMGKPHQSYLSTKMMNIEEVFKTDPLKSKWSTQRKMFFENLSRQGWCFIEGKIEDLYELIHDISEFNVSHEVKLTKKCFNFPQTFDRVNARKQTTVGMLTRKNVDPIF